MSEHIHAPLDTGTAAAVAPRAIPPLALLYSDESLLTHLESALAEMGAPVIYRAPLARADRGALLGARPAVTLINLDEGCDENLDRVTAWLDAAHMPVVFNDADISRGLEGWARARWARHLAAKLRGSEDVDPPRPVQAGLSPSAQPVLAGADDGSMQGFDLAANEVAEIVPIASRPLTPGEISSLLADFPSQPAANGNDSGVSPAPAAQTGATGDMSAEDAGVEDDTALLSAQVDALLAEPVDTAPAQPAPWEVIAPLAEAPIAAPANEAAPAAPSAAVPGASNWQLVDDAEPVLPAPRERTQATAALRMEFDFELEPLEEVAPAVVREREFEEMRLEKAAAKPAEANP